MKTLLLTALVLGFFSTCCYSNHAVAADTTNKYTLYLIRHAEKQPDGSRDPVLTEAGKQRSEQLANWFQDKGLEDVWSSDYHRTRDTVQPLLTQLGLQLHIYDPGIQTTLVKQLQDRQHNALIVGHSNTTPELARLLCDCTIADMDDSEHDRIIVISIVDEAVVASTLRQNPLFLP